MYSYTASAIRAMASSACASVIPFVNTEMAKERSGA